mmetsp:Transcript_42205/g.99004  ORF Transcript_42205/g.99004 Transcript_42205/m.99004 type:complete len:203 (+) Transcript_42205:590-1198(+)
MRLCITTAGDVLTRRSSATHLAFDRVIPPEVPQLFLAVDAVEERLELLLVPHLRPVSDPAESRLDHQRGLRVLLRVLALADQDRHIPPPRWRRTVQTRLQGRVDSLGNVLPLHEKVLARVRGRVFKFSVIAASFGVAVLLRELRALVLCVFFLFPLCVVFLFLLRCRCFWILRAHDAPDSSREEQRRSTHNATIAASRPSMP